MIAQYGEGSYIDIDSVSALVVDTTNKDSSKWTASFVCDGQGGTIIGKEVAALLEAFKWKWRGSIYDMRPESPNYQKQGEF